jgi:uncharacterized membrane protein SpoIIM required for sporulation
VDLDSYIAKYGPEWKRLDEATARGASGLAKLDGPQIRDVVRLYLRASGHLAEVQTRYRDPRVMAYLNAVVGRAHGALYSAAPRSLRGGVRIFGARYREAIRRTAPFILAAAGLFLVITIAAALWVANSREAQVGILPPAAREAIRHAHGERADLGLDAAAVSTFILVNNLQVAFLAFATGIALGIGTVYLVVQNAVLLGVLAGAFAAAGKSGPFWSLILPHGLLEITAICIAAGAGFRMGWSLVEPGDRPRSRALAEEARDAVMVVLGVMPAFGVAAIIEGFVTGSALPNPIELAIGAAVAAGYVLLLFGWRPVRARPAYPSPVWGTKAR